MELPVSPLAKMRTNLAHPLLISLAKCKNKLKKKYFGDLGIILAVMSQRVQLVGSGPSHSQCNKQRANFL